MVWQCMSWNVRIVSFAVTPSGEGAPSLLGDQPLRMKITMNPSRTRNVSLKKNPAIFIEVGWQVIGSWEIIWWPLDLGKWGGQEVCRDEQPTDQRMETHKLPWRCWGLALGSSKDPSNGVQGEKRWPRAPLCNSALVRLTKLRPEKSKLILVSNRGLRVTFFSPWAEGGGSGGSSWPSHTFFKLPERSAVIVSGYNPRWSLVHSPTYGWGRPSQCTQGEWLAPAPISSHSKTLHLSPGRFHAALPSSQRSSQQRGPQLQSPQLSLLQEQTHLWLQGQHSSGP